MDYRCHVEVTQEMRIGKLDLDCRRLVAKGRGAYNSIIVYQIDVQVDTGHKALCPVSLPRTRAYYGHVPGIL